MPLMFGDFLKSRGIGLRTSASVLSRIRRIYNAYGDLDDLFEADGLAHVIAQLNYDADDERADRPNPSRVPVEGNVREGLASLKRATCLYAEYLDLRGDTKAIVSAATHHSTVARRQRSTESVLLSTIPNGVDVLTASTTAMGLNLIELVARSSIWAHPNIVAELMRFSPHAVWFPGFRRMKNGETRGTVVRGDRLDDNSYANQAIKLATSGTRRMPNFHACHVWPKTCYDARYHTSIANLLLLPASLAGLSDHNDIVAASLRYRAFELFGWRPDDETPPEPPDLYPAVEVWREIPEPNDRILRIVSEKIPRLRAETSYPFTST